MLAAEERAKVATAKEEKASSSVTMMSEVVQALGQSETARVQLEFRVSEAENQAKAALKRATQAAKW